MKKTLCLPLIALLSLSGCAIITGNFSPDKSSGEDSSAETTSEDSASTSGEIISTGEEASSDSEDESISSESSESSQEIPVSDNLFYRLSDDRSHYAVGLSNVSTGKDIRIPDTYEGLPVTEILPNGFKQGSFPSITLPSGLKTIGEKAFANCKQLKSITFPETLEYIGREAFYASGLTGTLEFNSAVTIDGSAFYNANKLTAVHFNVGHASTNAAFDLKNGFTEFTFDETCDIYEVNLAMLPTVTVEDGLIYCPAGNNPYSILVGSEKTVSGEVTVKEGCRIIQSGLGSKNITAIHLPSTLERLDSLSGNLFTSLELPSSLRYIGPSCFSNCRLLRRLDIPSSVTFIGENAFNECYGLRQIRNFSDVSLDNTGASQYAMRIGKNIEYLDPIDDFLVDSSGCLWNYYGEKTALTIPDYVVVPGSDPAQEIRITSIAPYAFYRSAITEVTLPQYLTKIGTGAFSSASQLTEITLPASVTTIETSAFASTKIASVTLPAGLKTLGVTAFPRACHFAVAGSGLFSADASGALYTSSSYGGLKLLALPSDIEGKYTARSNTKEIGDYACSTCGKLTTFALPGKAHVGAYSFSMCGSLTSIVDSSSGYVVGPLSMKDHAFSNCTSLREARLDYMTSSSIPESAFQYCQKLDTVRLASTITTIGRLAFGNTGIYHIDLSNIERIEDQAFYGAPVSMVTFGDKLEAVGEQAFKDSLSSVNLPASIHTIGNGAFCGAEVTVDENNPYFKSEYGVLYSKDGTVLITVPTKDYYYYTISSTVTKIVSYAFRGGTADPITIPVSVTEIESNAFYADSTPYGFVYEGTTAQFFAIKKGRGFSYSSSTAGRTKYVTTADGKTSTDTL